MSRFSSALTRNWNGQIAAIWLVAMVFAGAGLAVGCGSSDSVENDGNGDLNVGEQDAGGEDVADLDACQAESDEELCQRLDVECGSLTAEDDCGDERLVHCEDFDGFQCEDPQVCAYAADDDDLDTNVCRCPELGDEPAAQICDYAGAECGSVNAGEVCEAWDSLGDVECGECGGDDECGAEIENICGCPCEIDGVCYADGDASPDDACLICDSEESEDEFAEAPDGTECGDGGICESGQCVCGEDATECGDECVDLDSDRNHCGECDNACGDEEICSDGECESSCPEGESICDEICVDQQTDPAHCGECGNECPEGDDGEAVCEDGECVITCENETDEVCDGECVDTSDDPDHCGGCDEECTTDVTGAEAICDDGDCEVICQNDDDEICDEACVDTDTDRDHCGQCDNDCATNEFCNSGECVDISGSCDDDDQCGQAEQCCNGQCLPAAQPCPGG